MSGAQTETILVEALRPRLRHIDTFSQNLPKTEADVGVPFAQPALPATDIHHHKRSGPANYPVEVHVRRSTKAWPVFKPTTVDLPASCTGLVVERLCEQIEGLNRQWKQGRAAHIGVSNYNSDMLRTAQRCRRTRCHQPGRISSVSRSNSCFGTSRCRTVQSDGILRDGGRRVFQSDLIGTIAARHQRSIAQVVLRWLVQQAARCWPCHARKPSNAFGQQSDLRLFLADDEMADISSLHLREAGSSIRRT